MNQNSQAESTEASLKMIVDRFQAIAPSSFNTSRHSASSVAPVADFLEQLSFPEVKAIYVIIQAGRNPSWLEEIHSIVPLYENLIGIRPANEGKQSCIDFLLPKIDHIQTYIARYIEVCNELGIDPLMDLEFLTYSEKAQHH
ncbi:hypothetical protein [Marinobacter salarius]|uniref:Uncharacterized protein n=1 Tax=Marinobacter salarius TaxID=1420917 RepID=A0A1W6KBF2_9GAMM|nr:hypothetical protein [Marinobacter salarius]ARM84765.1 hypothetical protein MARSALSMR5_02714 [Marinobacter salarius]AZR39679.1 hypothetical protein MTMN5_00205 [Marinobacter salarius]MBJ7302120.1 hypothetical protein [Marinobacter salarius]HIO31784.1 hypothetical protein [Marinobacter salarius]HIP01527.1 hypothetical protein [Marinobacter salarius]